MPARESCGPRGHPRVGGIDTVHVGEDLADIGLPGRRQGDRRKVGTSAPEGRYLAVQVDPLEAGHDDHLALLELVRNVPSLDVDQAGLGMDVVGQDAGLGARPGDSGLPNGMQRNGGQGDGFLLADGEQHVHFPFVRLRVQRPGVGDEAVGHPTPC